MPADLTREEIEWMRDDFALASDLEPGDIYRLFSHIKGEPARIASARQEGYREGVADAKHAAGFAAWRHEGDDARSRGMDAGARHQVAECVKAIAALSPLPAEPSAPVAPDWPTRCADLEADGIAARKRVAALEAENTKLRAALGSYPNPSKYCGMHGFEEQRFFADYDTFRSRARALLQGGPDAG